MYVKRACPGVKNVFCPDSDEIQIAHEVGKNTGFNRTTERSCSSFVLTFCVCVDLVSER